MNDDYLKYFPHADLKPKRPSDSDRLVRFLPLTKALHLLETQTLHFTRLDNFKDKYEGLWTDEDVKRWGRYEGFNVPHFSMIFRKTTAISCWSMVNESLDISRMWEDYIPMKQGIAIIVQASNLCEEMRRGLAKIKADFCNIVIAEVDYINRSNHSNLDALGPNQPLCNSTLPYYQKNKTYSYENETRILLFAGINNKGQMVIPEDGVDLSVDTSKLIDRIWLPPDIYGWERLVFHRLLDKYHLNIESK